MGHRVSVVVRTKNRPEFLERALADIAAQIFQDAAVIVVDDGGSLDVVERVVGDSLVRDRATVLTAAAPGGRCAAANAGVRAADSEYIVLHDDDDLWHPAFLADTVALLDARPEWAGVSTATEIVYEELRDGVWAEAGRAPFWRNMTRISLQEMLDVNRIVPISFLYRRVLHDELGDYDETLDAVEDWDFYLRVLRSHSIGFVPGEPRAYWVQRPKAEGSAANSMFDLAFQHARDDAVVRDRALREWIKSNGPGLPLYLASLEDRMRADFARELTEALDRQREEVVRLVYERHPVWRRLSNLRLRFARAGAPEQP